MKKILFIGKSGCGKTTLTQKINGESLNYKKTQSVEYYDNIIDTPGEYLENRMLYNALMVSSYDTDVIGMVQAVNDDDSKFPPGFASAFTKPVIGIVAKADLEGNLEKIKESLYIAGAEEIFVVSAYDSTGIDKLKEYLRKK